MRITCIKKFNNFRYLKTLDLSYNYIRFVPILTMPNLKSLSLHHNYIECADNLITLPSLQYLGLNFNKIQCISNLLKGCRKLRCIDVNYNNISYDNFNTINTTIVKISAKGVFKDRLTGLVNLKALSTLILS